MTTEQVLPALALSPSGEVTFEEVTAALVFHLRDYDPVRDNYQLPQAADQVAELYATIVFHKAISCALASLPPELVLLLMPFPLSPHPSQTPVTED